MEPGKSLWRISNHATLNGEGGLRYQGRWHNIGRQVVYLAESPAGALVEVLVHLDLDDDELPPCYTLLQVEVPDAVDVAEIAIPAGDAWKANFAVSRWLGDEWLSGRTTALARVPSAILPSTFNYLLNPLRPDAEKIRIVSQTRAEFDPRLLRHLR